MLILFPGDDQNENPLNDVAFNINLTKSDKVKTAFYSFNDKKSICDFTAKDYNDLRNINNKHEFVIAEQWKESGENEYDLLDFFNSIKIINLNMLQILIIIV